MKDYTFTQQFILIGLDGLDSLHTSTAKTAVMRGIQAAMFLEENLELLEQNTNSEFQEAWKMIESQIHKLDKTDVESLEKIVTAPLKEDGTLEEIQDLLACDINYESAGIDIKVYRTEASVYQKISESIRTEILGDGEISTECFGLLWLMRESCCVHEHFSTEEQKRIEQRMIQITLAKPNYRMIWETEFHNIFEHAILKFLNAKSNLFKNPYLEGVNLAYPYLERRKAIFIDVVVLGTTVASRRLATIEHLNKHGHYVEEVKNGTETLLKIDNSFYRIWPSARRYYKIPVQGVNLIPVYK